ncbi:MAG TPA: DUF4743 domain-containing protein [Burkholderiaceae bacterium]|nr:DUF4743 domain-containing protein [Burkholderiaceae bacterium]
MIDFARVQRLVERLQAHAQQPLPANLVPLATEKVQIGLAQPAVARFIAQHVRGFEWTQDVLTMSCAVGDFDSLTALLAEAATRLREAGMIRGWRGEKLAVGNPALATIERAACRPLGITTEAVHLNAYVAADALIVARRSALKQIDPDLWDNLVGGMVAAHETLNEALEREAWEEAGLRLECCTSLTPGRSFKMHRLVPEGLQSEIIHVYDAVLQNGQSLINQDGEVAAIERRSIDQVVDAIESDQFTLESALTTLESLTRGDTSIATTLFR